MLKSVFGLQLSLSFVSSVVKYEPVGVVTTFKEEPVIYEEVHADDSESVVLTTTTGGGEELASYQFIRVPIQDVVVETAETQHTDVNSDEIAEFIIPDTEKVQIVTNCTRKKKSFAPKVSKSPRSGKSKVEITSDNESVSKNCQLANGLKKIRKKPLRKILQPNYI